MNSQIGNTVYYVKVDTLLRRTGGVGSEQGYDQLKFMVALQGLLNREKPCFFIEQITKNDDSLIKDESNFDVDRFWFDWLKTQNYMGNDLPDYQEIFLPDLDALLEQTPLRAFILKQGYCVWDPAVPATANVVSTICGIEGYLPVMHGGSVEAALKKLGAEEKISLVDKFTGQGTIWQTGRPTTTSRKCDAYIWALETYGDKVNSHQVGYLVDSYAMRPASPAAQNLLQNGFNYASNQVVSHDYFILHKGFVFDLSCFTDAIPLDDQGYGRTDTAVEYETFKEILLKLYNRNEGEIGNLVGFTPWTFKYTAHTNERPEYGGLDGETTFVALCNAYNFIVDSDAPGMASLSNTSFYSHVKLAAHYDNPKPPKIPYNPAKKYLHIYMGDYDGSAWTNRFVAKYFKKTDPSYHNAGEKELEYRGDKIITWAFNPNLSQRVPQAFWYMMENRTDKDYFIVGDSGAGYVFPDLFREDNPTRKAISGLPDGMEIFKKWNIRYYNQFGLDTTGFLLSHDVRINGQNIINPITREVMDMFAAFSAGGINASRLPEGENVIPKGQFNAQYKTKDGLIPVTLHNGDVYGGSHRAAQFGEQILERLHTAGDEDVCLCFRSIIVSPHDIQCIQDYVTSHDDRVVFTDMYNFFEMHKAAYGG